MPRREQLEQMLSSDPNDVFLNYALAKALAEEGRAEDALEQFRKTLQLDPKHVASYFQMAQIQSAAGDADTARETVTQGIEVGRRLGDTHAVKEMTEFLEAL